MTFQCNLSDTITCLLPIVSLILSYFPFKAHKSLPNTKSVFLNPSYYQVHPGIKHSFPVSLKPNTNPQVSTSHTLVPYRIQSRSQLVVTLLECNTYIMSTSHPTYSSPPQPPPMLMFQTNVHFTALP